jgi:hypothetical protein
MQPTTQHSYLGPRDVRPFVMDQAAVEQFGALAKLGINLPAQRVREMVKASSGYAMDDAVQNLLTTASVPTPVQFLQSWLPGFVGTITAARKIDQLIGISTVGSWEDEQVVQGYLEVTGTSVPYGDYTNVPKASWNLNFQTSTVVRFEEGLGVGVLEEMRSARIRVSSADSKRTGAAQSLEIQRNGIGFYGYNGGANRTYGFLNEPNLPAYVPVAATGTGGSTEWADKTFLEIVADIRTALIQLRSQSKDTIDPETTPITLAIATDCVDYLSVTSDFGNSVRDWLTTTYPKVRVVSAPELNAATAGDNVFYIYAEQVSDGISTDDMRTWIQMVQSKFMVVGVAKTAKGFEEDYANATAGVMLKRPYAVARYSGI